MSERWNVEPAMKVAALDLLKVSERLREDGNEELAESYHQQYVARHEHNRHLEKLLRESETSGSGVAIARWLLENGWTAPDVLIANRIEEAK